MGLFSFVSDLEGDFGTIVVLTVLYVLQGIPLGLSSTISILLQQQHVSYSQQALFSLSSQPYSLKMLWAPVVDAVWSRRMGRRKTWIVPLQLTIGLMLIVFSSTIETTLHSPDPNVGFLTACFGTFYLLAATQDIAVDAWALTMLSEKNKGWQSTCNSVGQTLGIHIANSLFLALNDPKFLSSYRGHEGSIISLRQFSIASGIIFILVTLYVLFFVKEKSISSITIKEEKTQDTDLNKEAEDDPLLIRRRSPRIDSSKDDYPDHPDNESSLSESSLRDTYQLYLHILKNPYFLRLALILLTNRIGVFPAEAASSLRLIDKGMEGVALTSLKMFYFPVEMILTILISRLLVKTHPLKLMQHCYVFRIIMALLIAWFIHVLPEVDAGMMERKYYPIAYLLIILSSMSAQSMNVSAMTYFAQISDPRFGGSYMSLFNTISNFGHNMYVSPFLSMIDMSSKKMCLKDSQVLMNNCSCKDTFMKCRSLGGSCVTTQDGFYLLAWPTFVYGVIWSFVMRKQFTMLRSVDNEKWKVI